MTKLPVYEMVINPDPLSDVEVSYVAFVDKPAIERNFLMFKEQKINFAVNEEKRIVSGPAMIADSLIYRKDDQGEYNVFFSKDTISQIALKFFKKDYHKNLNLFHDPTLSLDGVTIFESFISDKARGVHPMKGFEDLPDGTWFISAKVENDVVWNKIKAGEVRGFSVEGIFSYVKTERPQKEPLNQNSHLFETGFMSDLKELVKVLKQKFFGDSKTEFTLKDKTKCFVSELKIGGIVKINDKEAPEGKLEFLDGSSVNVGPAGVISAVNPVKASTDYTTKDGRALSIDNLAVGGIVMMNGAPAPDGEYELQDGTKCTVAAGIITAVVLPVAAVAPVAQTAAVLTPAQQMEALKAAIGKFASGSDADRVGNLEVVSKALMEYCFGWDMRKAEDDANKLAAIEVYKTTLQNYKTQLDLADQKLKLQGETIKGIFDIVEKIASNSAADPIGDNKNNFVSQMIQSKEDKLKELSKNLSELKLKKSA